VLAVEVFVTTDQRVLVNEIAPRPHNSGHITIEASRTSQFENHLRAILDWPLGSTEPTAPAAAMVNLIGNDSPPTRAGLAAALTVNEAHVHLYGKQSRPGRKLGHVTATGSTRAEAVARAREAAAHVMRGTVTAEDPAVTRQQGDQR
jgi:5-(carboxyamino)imidazole ribonucleotide synthase